MAITLYHCHEARSMRSLWLLHELGLEFELVVMPFDTRALRTPEYLAIHPLGRVPCLIDGGTKLFESGAITQYLCETYDPAGLGRSADHPERAEWLQWLHYAETIAVHGASLVQQFIVIQDDAQRSPLVQKLESKRLEKSIEVVDTTLRDREYLLASGFSAVDVAVGYSLHLGRAWTALEAFPRVNAYYQRLSARPAFQTSLPDRGAGSPLEGRP